MENLVSNGTGCDPVIFDMDVSPDSYSLEWLFDSDRMDHLPIEDQLKMYRCRDLKQSKLFRFGIGLWETLPSRKRRLVAPSMLAGDGSSCDISLWSVCWPLPLSIAGFNDGWQVFCLLTVER
jgi:hypothetical protein